jgi:calcium/calmodulin-dependent protein kinase (CaM kinase) II
MDPAALELIKLNQRLLESISAGDWETYVALCDPTITAFEPEARGQLVEGMQFHRFYFDLDTQRSASSTTMCSPQVRMLGDTAVVSYIRLVQQLDENRRPLTERFEETRVWHRDPHGWRHVHFHRSANT